MPRHQHTMPPVRQSDSASEETSPAKGSSRRLSIVLALPLILLASLSLLQWRTIAQLTREQQALLGQTNTLVSLREANNEYRTLMRQTADIARLRRNHRELTRLREEIAELTAEKQKAERLRLAAQQPQPLPANTAIDSPQPIDAPPPPAVSQTLDDEALAQQQSNACINQLKQIGLAARVHLRNKNVDVFPASPLDLVDELPAPGILTCPSDVDRAPVTRREQLLPQSVSYEYLSPGGDPSIPTVVLARCPIHGHVCRHDGLVFTQTQIEEGHARLEVVSGHLMALSATEEAPEPRLPEEVPIDGFPPEDLIPLDPADFENGFEPPHP